MLRKVINIFKSIDQINSKWKYLDLIYHWLSYSDCSRLSNTWIETHSTELIFSENEFLLIACKTPVSLMGKDSGNKPIIVPLFFNKHKYPQIATQTSKKFKKRDPFARQFINHFEQIIQDLDNRSCLPTKQQSSVNRLIIQPFPVQIEFS